MITFDLAFVEQLRETALAHPHNPLTNSMAPEECLFENVVYDGEFLNIMLTYEYFDDGKQIWHLTICGPDHTTANPTSVMHVVMIVLGEGPIREFTHMMPPEWQFMRQFMKEETRCYDPFKKEWIS